MPTPPDLQRPPGWERIGFTAFVLFLLAPMVAVALWRPLEPLPTGFLF